MILGSAARIGQDVTYPRSRPEGRPALRHPQPCYHQASRRDGRALAEKVLGSLATCPIPEVARRGRTLRSWRPEFLGYFDTGAANNGGTEAINSPVEVHRRIARSFRNRDNYRLRMLLIGGGLFP